MLHDSFSAGDSLVTSLAFLRMFASRGEAEQQKLFARRHLLGAAEHSMKHGTSWNSPNSSIAQTRHMGLAYTDQARGG